MAIDEHYVREQILRILPEGIKPPDGLSFGGHETVHHDQNDNLVSRVSGNKS